MNVTELQCHVKKITGRARYAPSSLDSDSLQNQCDMRIFIAARLDYVCPSGKLKEFSF